MDLSVKRKVGGICRIATAAFTLVFVQTSLFAQDGQVARGAARGALGGAAVGKLSGGDTGKAAAWGAGAGAVKGVAQKKRAAEQQEIHDLEMNNAYQAGYNDAMNGYAPRSVAGSSKSADQAQVARGAGRGALGGAAVGKLSDGDTGKGAAWGAGMGAMRGAAQKQRDQDEARIEDLELNNAYQAGYREAMNAKRSAQSDGGSYKK